LKAWFTGIVSLPNDSGQVKIPWALLNRLTEAACSPPEWARLELIGEHEEVWGRLVTGWLHNVSIPTKQCCETPSFAETHPIRT
jgi:hypothetical protein